ncbi:DNA polymerase III subunit gamma/tau [Methylonatrum kenyense]|uniref:DNA polymerase III subunit gamma/tau n=1 Tax=Methylonatrum kenyense TaxID=455253 RepID=UPI0020BEC688|nr:DNA polymerase III subunit gamma/tau [Methylonatrum kenyense]MCK8515757.1 DNA polymerase III subunit gamma/tau [Methylonatrum kenyense]
MSHQVLARKYRPRSFDELVGQQHVLRALANGMAQSRLHHAYLFTGTRGVGKTTLARILARCLNCEQGVSSTPCGACGACREIDEGRFVDLIEVDAASRTKVEDTRELLDNVQYAPTRGRYKIYLVDEVHMLSGHSFNALLKTLEEPPPHVVFLLATTDPQKLPATVLSRCLQFNLKRLPPDLIASHLRALLDQEQVEAEERALQRLARAADGSMRDALSLTDQALAFGSGALRDDDVASMLGSIDTRWVLDILQALQAGDGPALMQAADGLAEQAPDFSDVLAAMLETLHGLAVLQTVPEAADQDDPEFEQLQQLAEALAPEDVQLFYQIALNGRRDLALAPDPRLGFDMVLLRLLAFRPDAGETPDPSSGAGRQPKPRSAAASPRPKKPEPTATAPAPQTATAVPEPAVEEALPGDRGDSTTQEAPDSQAAASKSVPPWPQLLEQLGLSGMSQELAMQCHWGRQDQDLVVLHLDRAHIHLCMPPLEKRLREALSDWFGRPVTLRIEPVEAAATQTPAAMADEQRRQRQRLAEQAIDGDPTVSALRETFGAEIVPDSVQPRGH